MTNGLISRQKGIASIDGSTLDAEDPKILSTTLVRNNPGLPGDTVFKFVLFRE